MIIGGKEITVSKIKNYFENRYLDLYYWYYPKYKIRQIRNQSKPIIVVFVLCDLSTWKTENLYLAMQKHERFNPILALTRNTHLLGHEKAVSDYIESKGYPYVTLDENRAIDEQLVADIICYQRPYNEDPVKHWVRKEHIWDNVDECTRRSFGLYYQGHTIDDIRQFINSVIAEQDERKEERMLFVNQYLRPPHGKTACENIMNAILGIEEYKES